MSSTILGIDLGSHSVKIVALSVGFREVEWTGTFSAPRFVSAEGETDLQLGIRTAAHLIEQNGLRADGYAISLQGELRYRSLHFPFAERRKILQVLPFELESHLLGDLSTELFDVIVAPAPDGARALAVVAPKANVLELLRVATLLGSEPKLIGSCGLASSCACLFQKGKTEYPAPVLLLDVGHERTQLCVLEGHRVLYVRTVRRGGSQVTAELARALRVEQAQAEEIKHKQAAWVENPTGLVEHAVDSAMKPWLREVRQTLAAVRTEIGVEPQSILLAGGGSLLRGVHEVLGQELGLSITSLSLSPFHAPSPLTVEQSVTSAHAFGLALALTETVPQVNFRQGDLAYRADYTYLKSKGRSLAIGLGLLVLFFCINLWAAFRAQRKQAETLEFQFRQSTIEIFGEPRNDPKMASEEVRQGPKGGIPPLPTLTAYDLLDEISRHTPAKTKGRYDVLELDIKPKKIFIKATAESAQLIDDWIAELEKISCFEKIEKGKVSTVTAPPSGDTVTTDKNAELKQFTLTIGSTCL